MIKYYIQTTCLISSNSWARCWVWFWPNFEKVVQMEVFGKWNITVTTIHQNVADFPFVLLAKITRDSMNISDYELWQITMALQSLGDDYWTFLGLQQLLRPQQKSYLPLTAHWGGIVFKFDAIRGWITSLKSQVNLPSPPLPSPCLPFFIVNISTYIYIYMNPVKFESRYLILA